MKLRIRPANICASAMALFVVAGMSAPAEAACTVNVFVKNVGKNRIWIRNELAPNGDGTAVQATAGGWRALNKGGWAPQGIVDRERGPFFGLNSNQRIGDGYDTALGCNVRRRFRFEYICDSGPSDGSRFVKYYPSVDTWTPQAGMDIIDVELGSKCN